MTPITLWMHAKREALGDRETVTIDTSALDACHYIIDMSPCERRRKTGCYRGPSD
jgi:hypothetical protein